jgi:O-antigen/teichoic acid export membrane protein
VFLVLGKAYLTRLYSVEFVPLILLTAILPLLMQIRLFGHAHLRSNLKTAQIAIPSVLVFFLNLGGSLFLMSCLESELHGRFYGIFLARFATCAYYIYILIRDRLIVFRVDKEIIWKALKFSLPLVPLAVSSWVTRLSDRIIITIYADVAEAGLYDVGYKLSEGIRVFTESVFQVYSPVMISMYTSDKSEFNVKVGKFVTYFIWIMFFAAFYISIFSKELLWFFTAPAYHSVYTLIPVVVFGYFISAQQKYLGSVFSLRQVTYLSTIGYFLQALLNLGLNLAFIPTMGKEAAAWATFFSLAFLTVWCGFWFLRWEKVQFEWYKIIRIFVIGFLTFISYLLVSNLFSYGPITMLLLKAVATVPITVVLSSVWGVVRLDQLRTMFSRR